MVAGGTLCRHPFRMGRGSVGTGGGSCFHPHRNQDESQQRARTGPSGVTQKSVLYRGHTVPKLRPAVEWTVV